MAASAQYDRQTNAGPAVRSRDCPGSLAPLFTHVKRTPPVFLFQGDATAPSLSVFGKSDRHRHHLRRRIISGERAGASGVIVCLSRDTVLLGTLSELSVQVASERASQLIQGRTLKPILYAFQKSTRFASNMGDACGSATSWNDPGDDMGREIVNPVFKVPADVR
jgi:hypothetical protein